MGKNIFNNVSFSFNIDRYHSLATVENTMTEDLIVTAKTLEDDVIMGIEYISMLIYGGEISS